MIRNKVSVGDSFGELTVIGKPFMVREMAGARFRRWSYCVVQCKCGAVLCGHVGDYKNKVRSCFACAKKRTGEAMRKPEGHVKLRQLLRSMRSRCENPANEYWFNYGGRGISVCEQWRESVECFIAWALSNGWSHGLEIDRIDNNGGYSPDNCRFVTRVVNSRNRRNNTVLEIDGESKSMVEWSEDERCSVGYGTIRSRIRYGWSHKDAVMMPRTRNMTDLRAPD